MADTSINAIAQSVRASGFTTRRSQVQVLVALPTTRIFQVRLLAVLFLKVVVTLEVSVFGLANLNTSGWNPWLHPFTIPNSSVGRARD